MSFTCENREFSFEGLVIDNLDVDVLAGTPSMEANDRLLLAMIPPMLIDPRSQQWSAQPPVEL